MILTLEDAKTHLKSDTDEPEELALIQDLIEAAEDYLKGATGKEYPEINETGEEIKYPLEKLYIKLLVAYWYDNRAPMGTVNEDFTASTRPLMTQMKLK